MADRAHKSRSRLQRLALFGGLAAMLALCGAAARPDAMAERRARLASLSVEEQQKLLEQQRRFKALPAEEQQRLRALHAEIERAADGPRLIAVLTAYRDWLKMLSPGLRAELLAQQPDERIKRIAVLKAEEAQRRLAAASKLPLSEGDLRAIFTWLEDLVWAKRERLLANIPEQRRQQVEKLDEPTRRRALVWMIMQRGAAGAANEWSPTVEDVQRLFERLSPPLREQITRAETNERRTLLQSWVQMAVQHKFESLGPAKPFPLIAEEELERYFATEITSQERDRLLNMPREQLQFELRRMYMQDPRNAEAGRQWMRPALPGELGGPRRGMPPVARPGDGVERPFNKRKPDREELRPPEPRRDEPRKEEPRRDDAAEKPPPPRKP